MMSSPLAQLIVARLREFIREPEVVFWVFGFPLVMTALLGIAFREQPVDYVPVDVREGSLAELVRSALASAGNFKVTTCTDTECRSRLRIGKTALVIVPVDGATPRFDYLYDPTRRESVAARREVDDALQRAQGRKDIFLPSDHEFKEPGGRYIDFLVPGLLGMGIMGGGMWGVGFATVDMRIRKLLKRFLATPMKKFHFLLGLIVSRLLIQIPEVVILIVFAKFVFGVKVHGSFIALSLLVLLGSLAFCGLGLLVSSRAKTIEAVSGMMNLAMMPMWILSGIFFSYNRYPELAQRFIRLLPLTALIDALRAIMVDGAALFSQTTELATLTAYTVLTFALALRFFRWQ